MKNLKNLNLLKLLAAFMVIAVSTVMTGCVDDNDTEAPFLTVTPTNMVFGDDGTPADGGQNYFEIETNRHWTATVSNGSWLTLSAYEGDGSAKVYLEIPEGVNDEATITVQISNKIGALAQEFITVKSGTVVETETIYSTTVGTTSVSSPYPYVDAYTDWAATGTGCSTVTYSGTNATVRASGLSNSGAYDGASGPNVVFFGSGSPVFTINKITMPSSKDFKLTFGAQCSVSTTRATYDNTFQKDKFIVELSANGSTWTKIDYSVNDGDQATPYWVLATADFTLENAVSELYIRFSTTLASSCRLDDITLVTSNGGGTTINLENGSSEDPSTPDTPTATDAIFNTTVGTTSVSSPYPYVDAYEGWDKNGSGASTATFSGNNATVRASGLSNAGAYNGASGPNVVFFGTGTPYFCINTITMPSSKDFQLTFGAQCSYSTTRATYVNDFEKDNFTVELSADGSKWTKIDYSINEGDKANPYWVLATADFTLQNTVSSLYIRFTAGRASAFRLDDITLATGNGGTVINLENGTSDSGSGDSGSGDSGSGSGTTNDSPIELTGNTITVDFSDANAYPSDFPTSKTVDAATYTVGGYPFTFAGSTGYGFYKASGYLMLGRAGAYLEFPAVKGKKLTAVKCTTRSGASGNVQVSVTDAAGTVVTGGDALKWEQTEPYEYSYTLSGTATETKYRLVVANAYNAQLTNLVLTFE